MQRYAITNGATGAQVEAWARAGVEWVQIREPGLGVAALLRLTEELAAMCRAGQGQTRLLVNGLDAASALGAGAEGVHLRGGAGAAHVAAARELGARVSVSCHSLADIKHACCGGADALLWAPVFGKTVDGALVIQGSGLDALAAACRVAGETPVFALGGVTPQNAQQCLHAGTAGVAGIRLFAGELWREL